MKNLATCKPTEFVAQTAKIKNAVANWVEVIDLIKVRNIKPAYEVCPADATAEQRAAVIKRNAEIEEKQAMDNLNVLLDNMLAKHPKETLDILALCCFIEPEHVDDYSMDEYLQCIMEMMNCKGVRDFFLLLAQLQTAANSI